jgi:hypothetical protein
VHDVIVVIAFLVVFSLLVITALKGKYVFAVVGLLFTWFWIIGATRLAKPDSWWARHRYDASKLERSVERFKAQKAEQTHRASTGVPTVHEAESRVDRKCPHCKHQMRAEARVCESCGSESNPWIHHAGVWWIAGLKTGEWQWLDEEGDTWRWYRDGTPSSPGVTDMTPNLRVNPALVTPPETASPSETPSSSQLVPSDSPATTNELERLAALHERDALTDEEFRAAKARVLGL